MDKWLRTIAPKPSSNVSWSCPATRAEIDVELLKWSEEVKATTRHDKDSLLLCFFEHNLSELRFLSASDEYFMDRKLQITDLVRDGSN